jgi:hypothetical protein
MCRFHVWANHTWEVHCTGSGLFDTICSLLNLLRFSSLGRYNNSHQTACFKATGGLLLPNRALQSQQQSVVAVLCCKIWDDFSILGSAVRVATLQGFAVTVQYTIWWRLVSLVREPNKIHLLIFATNDSYKHHYTQAALCVPFRPVERLSVTSDQIFPNIFLYLRDVSLQLYFGHKESQKLIMYIIRTKETHQIITKLQIKIW